MKARYKLLLIAYSLICWSASLTPSPAFCQTPIACGEVAAGTISSTTRVVTYTFTATAGDVITIRAGRTAVSSLFKLYLELSSPDGSPLDSALWQINRTLTVTGDYTLKVRDDDNANTGGFLVTWQRLNGNPGNAALLDCGQTAAGTIGTTTTAPLWRYYTFTGAPGDVVTLRAGRTAVSSLFIVSLELYGPDGTQVAAGAWQHNLTLTAGGTYTVIVRDDDLANTGGFLVTWQRLNGNPGNVALLDCGQTAAGTIGTTTTAPLWWYYTFTGAPGDVLTLRAGRTAVSSLFVVSLELYGPDGTQVAAGAWQHDLTLTAGGTYTVIVRDDDLANTGGFLVTWQRLNGNPGNAAPLDCGQAVAGTIGTTTTAPLWSYSSITGATGNVVTFRAARSIVSSLFIVYLELYAPDGSQVATGAWQLNQTLTQNGTYTVIVRDDDLANGGGFVFTWQRLNSMPANTTALSCGQTVAGSLGTTANPPPWRYYSFFVKEANDLIMLQTAKTSISSLFNVYLELFGPDGALLGSALEKLETVMPTAGTYTLIARDDDLAHSGTYNLSLSGCYLNPNNPAVQYSYDQLGRLTGVLYPSGKYITYTYDERGNRTQETVVGGK